MIKLNNKKVIELKPTINKRNNQISFSIKKNSLPKNIKDKLSCLKSINFEVSNLNFEEKFEEKWKK